MRIAAWTILLLCLFISNTQCAEIRRVAIYYFDPWGTTITPLSPDDVVALAKEGAPGTLSVMLEGAMLTVALSKLELPQEKPKVSAVEPTNVDVRIVFRFYDASEKITQLSLCDAEEGFWDGGQPPPNKEQIKDFLQLLPAPIFDYTIDPKKWFERDRDQTKKGKN